MNNLQLVASLSPEDRINMQLMGLRPTNPADVKRYKSGKGLSSQEKIERAKVLFEGTNNLGGANERDEDITGKVGHVIPMEEIMREEAPRQMTEKDYRSQVNDSMSDYTSSGGKTFTTDDLMSFKRPQQKVNESVASVQKVNVEQVKLEGFNASKQYLNAFVINLQQPNTQNRLNLFKLLKVCLEGEAKYKNNPAAITAYKQGVAQAEQAMLKNIQG
jgi:hypothetical protein